MKRSAIGVIIIVILLCASGILIEIIWGKETNAFARVGALIVCVGIIFGSIDLKTTLERKFAERKKNLEDKRLENDMAFSNSDLDKEVRGTTDDVIEKETQKKNRAIKTHLYIDIGVAILGTLIRGFGDLIPL